MQKVLFPGLNWWLLLLIPFTFLGFYPSYFSTLFAPRNNIYHIHAFFMILWVVMAITQPFLIRFKKLRTHKLIGKLSYFIMPLVFITGYLVIRHTYHITITDETNEALQDSSPRSIDDIRTQAASTIIVGTVYFVWLVIFYTLAVFNRKTIVSHATYMFAATLTVLGPTVERLVYNILSYLKLDYNFFAENSVFITIMLVLVALLVYQKLNGYSIKAATVALVIYAVGIAGYFYLPDTRLWTSFVYLVM